MKVAIALAAALVGLSPATVSALSVGAEAADPVAEVRIAVMADGVIQVDGHAVTIEQLEARLDRATRDGASIAYYREGGAADPSPAAEAAMFAVLEGVMSRGLPLRLSSKPDFSDAVDEHGQPHPRAAQ